MATPGASSMAANGPGAQAAAAAAIASQRVTAAV